MNFGIGSVQTLKLNVVRLINSFTEYLNTFSCCFIMSLTNGKSFVFGFVLKFSTTLSEAIKHAQL